MGWADRLFGALTEQGNQRMRTLASVLVVLFGVLTVLAVSRYLDIERKLDFEVSENILWAAAQNEIELGNFVTALSEAAEKPGADERKRVEERFDILWSRVSLYQQGVHARSIANEPHLKQTIAGLFADLKAIEPALAASKTHDDFIAIRDRIRLHIGPMRAISMAALHSDRRERHAVMLAQRDIKRELFMLIATLLLLIGAVVISLLLSVRRARQHLAAATAARQEADAAWHRLDDAIESLGEGFVLYDRNDRLVTCNARYRAFFGGIAPIIKPGLAFEDFVRGAFAAGHLLAKGSIEEEIALRQDRRRKALGTPFLEPLGDGRYLQVSNRMTRSGAVVTVFNDVTELKTREFALIEARNDLEQQARRMQALVEVADAANRAKSDFLAMISHEIRTPMNAVLGLADLLSETRLTHEQKRYVAGIEESGEHLLGLINNILDFSKLEARKAELRLAPTDPRLIVEGAARMMAVLAEKKGLTLEAAIAADVPQRLMLDATHLNQVLINLIGNAIKFTRDGGARISVSAPRDEGSRLRIVVEDTGIGIPEAMRDTLFQPFERGTQDGREAISGTGLGLAITHRLITMMGGSIRLQDREGQGTAFEIDLPLVEAPRGAIEPQPLRLAADSERPHLRKGRPLAILVAEDTPASRLVIQTMLEKRGHRVTVVDDGAAAVTAALGADFDLLLLDIQMPRKSGLEAIAEIRASGGRRGRVPAVALSAQAFATDRERTLEAGFDAHLAKPVRSAELQALLESLDQGAFRQGEAPAQEVPQQASGEYLGELEAMCDPALFDRLLHMAIDNITLEHATLAEAAERADWVRLRRAAHNLAGILGQYGSGEAQDAASLVERADEAQLAELTPDLTAHVHRTLSALALRRQARGTSGALSAVG